jgi:predicted RNA binding protein YcfA (HicA-like mRNA interferase family)
LIDCRNNLLPAQGFSNSFQVASHLLFGHRRQRKVILKLADADNQQVMMVREIMSYWLERPDAKDTIEGIQKWWLRKNAAQRRRTDVQRALDCLTSQGWLIKREIAASIDLYGINPNRMDEIKEFLGSSEVPEFMKKQ